MPPLLPSDALFADFDGTLAALAPDPDAVRLSPARGARLVALAGRLGGALCVLSGRSLADLAARVPAALWRAGGHGRDVAPPGVAAGTSAPMPATLKSALAAVLAGFPDARLEDKGAVGAVHYRAAPGIGTALGEALAPVAEALDGYELKAGKMVWELRPAGHDKGSALTRLMRRPPFAGRRPVMLGDDVTDEDGFRAALTLGGLAVKVGPGETAAPHQLADVEAVWDWLDRTVR